MKMRTVEITVGAFMIAGIAALLMLALQVSGLSSIYKSTPGYKVYAEFTNIGALKARAKVSVAGVVIGRVVNIHLDPKSFEARVEMTLDPSFAETIPTDSKASILTAGLLGDNYISLSPGFNEEFLKAGSVIPVEKTDPAVVLEDLLSKFLANQATKGTGGTGETSLDSSSPKSTSNKGGHS